MLFRSGAHGEVLETPPADAIRRDLTAVYREGFRALAVVFMHGYRYPQHEQAVAAIARELGFAEVRSGPLVRSSYHAGGESGDSHALTLQGH